MSNITSGIAMLLRPHEMKWLLSGSNNDRDARRREYDGVALDKHVRGKLSLLLSHAVKTVPYYQKIWHEAGFSETVIHTPEATFQFLPTIDKFQLQAQGSIQLISSWVALQDIVGRIVLIRYGSNERVVTLESALIQKISSWVAKSSLQKLTKRVSL